jgi:putative transposase
MSLAFDKSTVVKEYKEANIILRKDKDNMAKKVGELTMERDFAVGKLKSLLKYIINTFSINYIFSPLKKEIN